MERPLIEKFTGCVLGGLVGDVAGAVVEAESPGYIRKAFKNVDHLLSIKSVPELFGGHWIVGKFTDDTQMTLGVLEWLLVDKVLDGSALLEIFSRNLEPWRRYAPGTRFILEAFPSHRENWKALATARFPDGSYGNGSAMRVAPVGLFFHHNLSRLIKAAVISASTTHAHSLSLQGAAIQAAAVAYAVRLQTTPSAAVLLHQLNSVLDWFEGQGHQTPHFRAALKDIERGISDKTSPLKMSERLGTGIKVQEAVPMAIYCFLANAGSFEKAVESAIFIGGDTDTIASMTGSLSGACAGESLIPKKWLEAVKEEKYDVAKFRSLAKSLHDVAQQHNFKGWELAQ